jgi:hypothetical protein
MILDKTLRELHSLTWSKNKVFAQETFVEFLE